jgi:hypothetical protein
VVVLVVARPSITFKCGGRRRSENLCAPTFCREAGAAGPVLSPQSMIVNLGSEAGANALVASTSVHILLYHPLVYNPAQPTKTHSLQYRTSTLDKNS